MKTVLKNHLREKLKHSDYVLGAFISTYTPSIIEILGINGLDFVVLDTEHASPGIESLENMIRAAEIYDLTAIVRVTDYDAKLIGRMLDIGAHGIQVPMVHTARRAREVVQAAKYAPDGKRGMSGGRGMRWGSIENYCEVSNQECMTVCMCETKEGVDNIEEIVRTPMLDVVFIGAVDLSQSLGKPWKVEDPYVEEHILRVLKACQNCDVIPGIVTSGAEEAKKRIRQGFRYVTILNDMRLFAACSENLIRNVREQ